MRTFEVRIGGPGTDRRIAMVGALGSSWALKLDWVTWGCAAVAVAALSVLALRISLHEIGWRASFERTATAAVYCLAGIGCVSLGYAAHALTHSGAVGPGSRLGYPLLVATGLRVSGGIGLLLLCAVVSVIPALFPNEAVSARS